MAKNDDYSYITAKTAEQLQQFIESDDIDPHEREIAVKRLNQLKRESGDN